LYVKREPDRSEGSPHPARFGRARRRARPSARCRRRLLSTCWAGAAAPFLNSSEAARGCALSKDRARTGRSQKIAPGLAAFNHVRHVSPDLSEVRVRPHKESGANSKRLTLAASVSANPNQVRVQRRASVQCVSANPNEVRVRGQSSPSFSASFVTHLNATWYKAVGPPPPRGASRFRRQG